MSNHDVSNRAELRLQTIVLMNIEICITEELFNDDDDDSLVVVEREFIGVNLD